MKIEFMARELKLESNISIFKQSECKMPCKWYIFEALLDTNHTPQPRYC